jgi:class 3 adenylate cyclase/tetratricopeptide (TPR) repeat protein
MGSTRFDALLARSRRDQRRGRLEDALRLARDAVEEARGLGAPLPIAQAELLVARQHIAKGHRPAEARAALERALRAAVEAEAPVTAGEIHCEIALLNAVAQRFEEADACLWSAARLVSEGGGTTSEAWAMVEHVRGRCAFFEGDLLAAEGHLAEAAFRARHDDMEELRARILLCWAEVLQQLGHSEASLHYLQLSRTLVDGLEGDSAQLGDVHIQAKTHGLLAQVAMLRGEAHTAREHLERDLALLVRSGRVREQGSVRARLAELALQRGDLGQAQAYLEESLGKARGNKALFFANIDLVRLDLRRYELAGFLDPATLEAAGPRHRDAMDRLGRMRAGSARDALEIWGRSVGGFLRWRRDDLDADEARDLFQQQLERAEALERVRALEQALEILLDLLVWQRRWASTQGAGGPPAASSTTIAERILDISEQLGATEHVRRMERWLREHLPLEHARLTLARYVPASINAWSRDLQEGERAVLYLDVMGFSEAARDLAPREVFDRLSDLFRMLNARVREHGGLLVRYVGDSLLATFEDGAEAEGSGSRSALCCALAMVSDLEAINTRRHQRGETPLGVGIGLHRGELALGRIVAQQRWQFTVHGEVVNLAAHLEGLTRKRGVSILASGAIMERAGATACRACAIGTRTLKHASERLEVHEVRPIIRFRPTFVGFGTKLPSTPGSLALDVGGLAQPGVIDHHMSQPELAGHCATSLVLAHPEWVTEHRIQAIGAGAHHRPEFVLHRAPDLDCCAAALLAQFLLEQREQRERGDPRVEPGAGADLILDDGVHRLAEYVRAVDQGRVLVGSRPEQSLYMVFMASHQQAIEEAAARGLDGPRADALLLERGMFVVYVALSRLRQDAALDPIRVFAQPGHPFLEEMRQVERDADAYQRDKARSERHRVRLPRRDEEGTIEVQLLRTEEPSSTYHKVWARDDGFPMLHVAYPLERVPDSLRKAQVTLRRQIISVDPEIDAHLPGLGRLLDEREQVERERIFREHGVDLRRRGRPREGFDNADPWYDGRGHAHTIVDSPNSGTVLCVAEVAGALRELFGC